MIIANSIRKFFDAVGAMIYGGERQSGDPSFNGARITRNNAGWQPRQSSGDSAIGDSFPLLHTRYRDLSINDPSIISAKRKMVAHIVGCGHQTFANVELEDNAELEDKYNDESDQWFERWCSRECDVEGKQYWGEMQRSVFAEEFGGDGLLLECFDDSPGRSVPLCYQTLEPEQLDRSKDRPASANQNRIVGGIELDRRNRAVAYYVYDAHPYDSYSGWTSQSIRIPAARVLHAYVPFRTSATRGINWCHGIMQASRDLDTFIDSELTASIIASLFTVVINREKGAGSGLGFYVGDEYVDPSNCNAPLTRLGKGIIADLGKDDKVTPVESKRPSPLVDSLVRVLRHLQAQGIGLSYLRLTGDYSQSSYTSARGAHLDDQAVFDPIQEHFANRIVLPVRRRHNDLAIVGGRIRSITSSEYRRNPFVWGEFDYFPPGREQLDPDGETESAGSRMRLGLSNLQQECGRLGLNWRKVLRQAKKEKELIERYKLQGWINFSKGGGAPELAERQAKRDARDLVPAGPPPEQRRSPAEDKEAE